MYEFYQIKYSAQDLKQSRKDLNRLYDAIPETDGCMENISKENGCGAWCCEQQSPQAMFVEFQNTWNTISNQWSKEKFSILLLRAIRVYLDAKTSNGCIFWDKDTKLCQQHSTRPFNCRSYGQVPDEDFKPRYERLKILYQDKPDAVIKEQCGLCTTLGAKPTSKDMSNWFAELKQLEKDFIPQVMVHDDLGGSYRTFHDHLLLKVASGTFLNKLTKLRTNGSQEEKDAFYKELQERLVADFPDLNMEQL